ncbi:MAG: DNA recombination protein RmuC [Clostridia bacterium]|nr:DNA recombination protein RmuC [Clostridia bacterium]
MSENIILPAILVLLCVCVVLLLVLIFRKKDSGAAEKILSENKSQHEVLLSQINSVAKVTAEEFSRNRGEQSRNEERLRRELNESMSNMNEHLKKMTEGNYEQRLVLMKTLSGSLEEIRNANAQQNEKQNTILEKSIEKLQLSNEQKLEQMRQTVDEKLNTTLATRLDASFKSVSEQLENVYKSLGEMKVLSTGVTDNVSSLNRILTNVKARGTWAEVQLENILDQTIPGMFDKNVMTNPTSRELVEFAVRIPSNDDKESITYLPIDSKFPMEDYVRLCEAADRGDSVMTQEARKALERRVIGCAKDIKKYIHEPDTTPFAIMYLATEGLYSEIISSPDGVAEKIQSEYSVMIAGPSTITALLNSLAMGFRAIAINEKAKEVRILLAAAKVQYDKFGDVLAKAKKKIEEAGRTLDDAQSRNSIIQKKLKNIEEIDAASATDILGIEE